MTYQSLPGSPALDKCTYFSSTSRTTAALMVAAARSLESQYFINENASHLEHFIAALYRLQHRKARYCICTGSGVLSMIIRIKFSKCMAESRLPLYFTSEVRCSKPVIYYPHYGKFYGDSRNHNGIKQLFWLIAAVYRGCDTTLTKPSSRPVLGYQSQPTGWLVINRTQCCVQDLLARALKVNYQVGSLQVFIQMRPVAWNTCKHRRIKAGLTWPTQRQLVKERCFHHNRMLMMPVCLQTCTKPVLLKAKTHIAENRALS